MTRLVVLDIESTGLDLAGGDRLISVGMVEMIDGVASGKTFEAIVNPERDSHPAALAVHRMTPEFLAAFPVFAERAQEIRNFIGDSRIIITCRTTEKNGTSFTLDEAMLTAEFERAGITSPLPSQWINVRRWAEALYGQDGARLDAVLDRYSISRTTRDELGHGALLDAQLLAQAYPRLRAEYAQMITASPPRPQTTAPKR